MLLLHLSAEIHRHILAFLSCEDTLAYMAVLEFAWNPMQFKGYVKRMVYYYDLLERWEGCACCLRSKFAPWIPTFTFSNYHHYVVAGNDVVLYLPQYLFCNNFQCVSKKHFSDTGCFPSLENYPALTFVDGVRYNENYVRSDDIIRFVFM